MTLFGQYFRAQFKGFLIWLAVAGLDALLLASAAKDFIGSNALTSLPPALMAMFGDIHGLNSVDVYVAYTVFKGMALIPPLYVVMLALSAVTREVDRRTIEFLMALPVQRTQLLFARVAVMVLNVSLMVGIEWAGIGFGLIRQGYQATWGNVALVFLNIWLLTLALGAVALLASVWIDDYSLGVKLFLGVATFAFMMELVLRAANVSRAVRAISPFSYVDAPAVLRTGAIPWGSAITLLAVIAAGAALSFWAFNRKQFTA